MLRWLFTEFRQFSENFWLFPVEFRLFAEFRLSQNLVFFLELRLFLLNSHNSDFEFRVLTEPQFKFRSEFWGWEFKVKILRQILDKLLKKKRQRKDTSRQEFASGSAHFNISLMWVKHITSKWGIKWGVLVLWQNAYLKKYFVTLTVIDSLDGSLVYSVRPDFSASPDVTLDWKVKTLCICPHQEVFPYTGSLSPCYSCTGQTNFIQQQTLSNTLKPLFCQHRP